MRPGDIAEGIGYPLLDLIYDDKKITHKN
jgi:hypothetical protein